VLALELPAGLQLERVVVGRKLDAEHLVVVARGHGQLAAITCDAQARAS
jgi:hypothetical protein